LATRIFTLATRIFALGYTDARIEQRGRMHELTRTYVLDNTNVCMRQRGRTHEPTRTYVLCQIPSYPVAEFD